MAGGLGGGYTIKEATIQRIAALHMGGKFKGEWSVGRDAMRLTLQPLFLQGFTITAEWANGDPQADANVNMIIDAAEKAYARAAGEEVRGG